MGREKATKEKRMLDAINWAKADNPDIHYEFWEKLLAKEGIKDKLFTLVGMTDEGWGWFVIDGKIYEAPGEEAAKKAEAVINQTMGYIVTEDGKMYHYLLYFDKDKNEIRLGRPEGINSFKEVSQKEIEELEHFSPGSYCFALRTLGKDSRYKEVMAHLLKEQSIERPFAYVHHQGPPEVEKRKSPEGVWLDVFDLHFPGGIVLRAELLWNKEKNDYEIKILKRFTEKDWKTGEEIAVIEAKEEEKIPPKLRPIVKQMWTEISMEDLFELIEILALKDRLGGGMTQVTMPIPEKLKSLKPLYEQIEKLSIAEYEKLMEITEKELFDFVEPVTEPTGTATTFQKELVKRVLEREIKEWEEKKK
ncbi:MAG: hypothetical protein WC604_01310 [Candidatus Gracilibacteria bacterium]